MREKEIRERLEELEENVKILGHEADLARWCYKHPKVSFYEMINFILDYLGLEAVCTDGREAVRLKKKEKNKKKKCKQ